jgi:hypothetical protein
MDIVLLVVIAITAGYSALATAVLFVIMRYVFRAPRKFTVLAAVCVFSATFATLWFTAPTIDL